MALTNSAIASPKNLYSGTLNTTVNTVLYTAPNTSTNVTAPSATAYIKEIIICNYTATATTVNIAVNGAIIIGGLSVVANDTKILSGLNTMLPANATITGNAGSAATISIIISGVEVQ